MNNELLTNLDKIRTTELGIVRVKRNLGLEADDIVDWCKLKIKEADKIIRIGKNWYVYAESAVITVNAYSFTIITAHKENRLSKLRGNFFTVEY